MPLASTFQSWWQINLETGGRKGSKLGGDVAREQKDDAAA
jgi:hypothetical protein